jgi:uncharacterized protein (TIGR02246 family)
MPVAFRWIAPPLAAWLALAGISASSSTPKEDEEAIRRVFDEDVAAHLAGDADRAAAVYTEDAVWLPPSGPPIQGRAAIRQRYRSNFERQVVRFSVQIEEIQVIGDWAFSRGTTLGTIQPKEGGAPRVLHNKFLAVFQRTNGGEWKIARLVWNPVGNSGAPQTSPACASPEFRQFDFWVGEWELSWPASETTGGKPGRGTNRIERALDACVIVEHFSGTPDMNLRGMSVSTFNPRTGKWQQTWVDNFGSYLDFAGEFQDGRMILVREATTQDGKKLLQRMVWENIQPDSLDWSWERSEDGGRTWTVLWPIHYQRAQ